MECDKNKEVVYMSKDSYDLFCDTILKDLNLYENVVNNPLNDII